jgi:hypothetical protein
MSKRREDGSLSIIAKNIKPYDPDDTWIHTMRFNNDRKIWPLLSKKYYQLWVRAGYASLSSQRFTNLFMHAPTLTKTLDWSVLRNQSKALDEFLKGVAVSLSSGQTILQEPQQENLLTLRKYRGAERLYALSSRIYNQENINLVELTSWLKKYTDAGGVRDLALERSEAMESILANWARNMLKYCSGPGFNGPISIRSEASLKALEDSVAAIPVELLSVKTIPPQVLEFALQLSIQRGQVPFVEALMRSPKNDVISLDVLGQALHQSIRENQKEHVRLLLANPRMPLNAIRETAMGVACGGNSPIANRLAMLPLFLVEPHVSAEALGEALNRVIYPVNPPISIADRISVIDAFLAEPRITDAVRRDALLHTSISQLPLVPLADRLRMLERCLADPLLSIEAREGEFEAVSWARNIPPADRQALMLMFLADPYLPTKARMDAVYWSFVKRHVGDFPVFETILNHPSATSSLLWKMMCPLFESSHLPHNQYRQKLAFIANHRLAANIPALARAFLAFERMWAFVTNPFHAILERVSEVVLPQIITAALFFPITFIRLAAFGALKLASRNS